MNVYELKDHVEEMIEQLELLLASGKIKPDDVRGLIMCLVIGDDIGANISKSILEMTKDEKCIILTKIALQLKISVQEYFEFNVGIIQTFLDKMLGERI